jgi:hypothetical protein
VNRKWTRQQVIDSIKSKTNTFYTRVNGKRADVGVVDGPQGEYMRTYADGVWNDIDRMTVLHVSLLKTFDDPPANPHIKARTEELNIAPSLTTFVEIAIPTLSGKVGMADLLVRELEAVSLRTNAPRQGVATKRSLFDSRTDKSWPLVPSGRLRSGDLARLTISRAGAGNLCGSYPPKHRPL